MPTRSEPLEGFKIETLVTNALAQTEKDLTAEGTEIDFALMKYTAIEQAKVDLYYGMPIPVERDMPPLVRYYLADAAIVQICELAADWYKTNFRMSDSKEGATYSYYDAVQVLNGIRQRRVARMAQVRPRVEILIRGGDVGVLAGIPTCSTLADGKKPVTPNPFDVARFLYGDYMEIEPPLPQRGHLRKV